MNKNVKRNIINLMEFFGRIGIYAILVIGSGKILEVYAPQDCCGIYPIFGLLGIIWCLTPFVKFIMELNND